MNRKTLRIALGAAGLAALSACVVNLAFEMKKDFAIKSDPSAPTSIVQDQLVQLSDYQEIVDHKQDITSFALDYAQATVTSIAADNNATTVSGSLYLGVSPKPDADHDIKVGDLTNVQIAQNATVKIVGTDAVNTFLLHQLQTAGTFYAHITGSVVGPAGATVNADLTLSVDLHADIGYNSGL